MKTSNFPTTPQSTRCVVKKTKKSLKNERRDGRENCGGNSSPESKNLLDKDELIDC